MLLRDCVHGLISFGPEHDEFIVRLLDTPEVQRLRRIRALGPASLAFPGAEHSRFAHAVGSAHVMSRYLARISTLESEIPAAYHLDTDMRKVALAAALLHDLGHGPYSHSFESVLSHAWPHEYWTSQILKDPQSGVHQVLASYNPEWIAKVDELIHGRCAIRHLAKAVSGTFDVDRCDYLIRDSHMTGVRYGHLDLDWLLASLRLHRLDESSAPRLAVDGEKGLTAVESFFLSRLYMYRQVYLHKAVRAAETMVQTLFLRVKEVGLPVGMAPGVQALLSRVLRGDSLEVRTYVQLDDVVLQQMIAAGRGASDPVLSELSEGIWNRRLFKSVALRSDVEMEEASQRLCEVVQRAGWDPKYFAHIDRIEIDGYTEDDALCVVYPNGRTQPILEVSPVLRGLSRERYVSVRALFPAPVRDEANRALRDLQ